MSMPRKIRCTVENIIDHGGRVYTVDLVPTTSVPPFRPGQFLHLTVEDYDPAGFWPESRVFSIASSPRERGRIRICYSVKGRYTTRMEQVLKAGGEVWIKLPYGDFVIDGGSDAVLIAGGTGISAFTAFLQSLTPQAGPRVTLIYGARTPALFLFQDMILSQLAAVPQFEAVFFAEIEDAAFTRQLAAHPKVPTCYAGRISLDAILRPPPSDLRPPSSVLCSLSSVFYLSGPPIMLSTLSQQLLARGVPADLVRTDAWE
jgi:ferredoxin-NADP reductase